MIMIKHLKNVKTWCFENNLMILCSRIYQQSRDIRPHECYPPLMCNKFERTHSKEQVMGITALMYTTVELMVRLLSNCQSTNCGGQFFHHCVTD